LLLLLLQGESRLEQYLQQDLQRYIDMREELDSQTSGFDAAVLSVPVEHQLHARTSSSSGSFVRFPEQHLLQEDDDEDAAAAAPLAPAAIAAAAAAAAAMAAVHDPATASVAASTAHAARVSWDSSYAAAAPPAGIVLELQLGHPAAAAAAAAETAAVADQEQQQGSASQLPFVMEDDAEIAAQKLAARARLAELEGGKASAAAAKTCAAAATAAPLPAGKAPAGKCIAEDEGGSGYEPGSVHSSRVPQRPRGLTGLVHSQRGSGGAELYSLAMGLQGKGESAMFSGAATRLQAVRFFQTMAAGLLLCLALLPALWALQVGSRAAVCVWARACSYAESARGVAMPKYQSQLCIVSVTAL
jgi:hypothetical protein